jgi:hypothetical protein
MMAAVRPPAAIAMMPGMAKLLTGSGHVTTIVLHNGTDGGVPRRKPAGNKDTRIDSPIVTEL